MPSDLINVKDFGAVGDGVTDDAPAIQAAIDAAALNVLNVDEFAGTFPVYLPPVDPGYRIKSEIRVRRTVTILGAGGRSVNPSRLLVDGNINGVNFRFREGSGAPPAYSQEPYSAQWASMKGLCIECDDDTSTSGNGVVSNVTVFLEDIFVRGFAENGFFINASGGGTSNDPDPLNETDPGGYYGNANISYLQFCSARVNKGNGFKFLGSDANACVLNCCDGTQNDLCGFLDESSLGNTYLGCHAAANGTQVEHLGSFYVCIQVHTSDAATEPGVGVDWREYWQEVIASVADLTWQTGVEYLRSGSYHSFQSAARNVYLGCYSEAGIQGPAALSRNDCAIGGNMTDGTGSLFLGINSATGAGVTMLGQDSFPIRVRGKSDDAVDQFRCSLGQEPNIATFFSCGHNDDDPSLIGYKLLYSKTRNTYEWIRDTTEVTVMTMTTDQWSSGGLTGDAQVMFDTGVIIGPRLGGSLGRVRSFADIASITPGLVVTTQDFFLLTGATTSGEPTMAKVTTAGTVGTDAVIVGVAPLP